MISWAWTPLIGIGLCAVANAAMFSAARWARPEPVEDRPWLRSAELDGEKAAAERFAGAGLRLVAVPVPGGALLTLGGPAVLAARLHVYRPDDRGADRSVAWTDPGAPLTLALPRPGRWLARLSAETATGTVVHDLELEVER
jgi:hypothetical protein